MNPNPSPLPAFATAVIRAALQAIGGALVTKGVFTDAQVTSLAGAGVVVVSVAWSLWQKYATNETLKVAIASPPPVASPSSKS